MKDLLKLFREHYLIILYLLFYGALVSYRLTSNITPFYDWDESLYIQTGREMIERNYYLFPVWQGAPWLDKPPLVPLLYGLVMKLFFFIPAELSTRLYTLSVALVVLVLTYVLYLRASSEKYIAVAAVAATSFIPIFFQRAQVVNLDIFLLLGWVGYIIFFDKTWLSVVFLLIATLSKSLIGFYPIAIAGTYYSYLYIFKKTPRREIISGVKRLALHTGIGLAWFVAMLAVYGGAFWRQHIIESHFRRITASIEFHFGARTFYLDLLMSQMGVLFWPSMFGLAVFLLYLAREKLNPKKMLYGFYLLPWFVFLNATKTKIFWYLFAAAAQFGFLSVFPMWLTRKYKHVYTCVFLLSLGVIIYQALVTNRLFSQVYSKPEPYYHLALSAKGQCNTLNVLLDEKTRASFDTLQGLGLLITTTKWWGDHPSMVYYFGKPVKFFYSKGEARKSFGKLKARECAVVHPEDLALAGKDKFALIKRFDTLTLMRAH